MQTHSGVTQKQEQLFIILSSIHYVLKAEKLLKEHAIDHDVIPVPRAVSSDCGMSLSVAAEKLPEVREILQHAQLDIARLYRRVCESSYEELK